MYNTLDSSSCQPATAVASRRKKRKPTASIQKLRSQKAMRQLLSPLDSGRQKHQTRLDSDGCTVWLCVPEDLLELLWGDIESLDIGTLRGVLQSADCIRRTSLCRKMPAGARTALNSKTMKGTTVRWPSAKRWMLEHEVIEVDRSYVVGARSMGYCFSEKWRRKPYKLLGFRDTVLHNKFQATAIRMGDEKEGLVLNWLREAIGRVQVDWDAFDAARKRESDKIERARKRHGELNRKWRRRERQLHYATFLLDEIKHGQVRFVIDEFSGRVHTSVSRVPRECRKHLFGPNGEKLVGLDVSCSQPLIAVSLAESAGHICPELKEACRTGQIYDAMQRECSIKNRDKAKRAFLFCLFRDQDDVRHPAEDWLRSQFPEFFRWVDSEKAKALQQRLKTILETKGAMAVERFLEDRSRLLATKKRVAEALADGEWMTFKKEPDKKLNPGGQELARKMQIAERSIIICPKPGHRSSGRGLCRRIWREARDMFVLTIHDCVVVPESDAPRVEQWLREEFRTFGIPEVNIKATPFSGD